MTMVKAQDETARPSNAGIIPRRSHDTPSTLQLTLGPSPLRDLLGELADSGPAIVPVPRRRLSDVIGASLAAIGRNSGKRSWSDRGGPAGSRLAQPWSPSSPGRFTFLINSVAVAHRRGDLSAFPSMRELLGVAASGPCPICVMASPRMRRVTWSRPHGNSSSATVRRRRQAWRIFKFGERFKLAGGFPARACAYEKGAVKR